LILFWRLHIMTGETCSATVTVDSSYPSSCNLTLTFWIRMFSTTNRRGKVPRTFGTSFIVQSGQRKPWRDASCPVRDRTPGRRLGLFTSVILPTPMSLQMIIFFSTYHSNMQNTALFRLRILKSCPWSYIWTWHEEDLLLWLILSSFKKEDSESVGD